MECLEHPGNKLKITKGWRPGVGIDPKMKRLCCIQCVDAWYHTPKLGLHRRNGKRLV